MSTKILVVDDEVDLKTLMLQRFRQFINAGKYSFRFVENAERALAALEEDPDVDVLLLDINMPGISGLTLLSKLADMNMVGRAVMVSAYGDINNIRVAMNRGAFDFVMKPIDFDDLQMTIDKTARHVAQVRESIHLRFMNEMKTRFFDNIAHEFRTPLTLILSPVERLIQQYGHLDDLRRNLETIERNARQLLRLINQLLDLAKLEAGRLTVEARPGNLNEFVSQLVNAFHTAAETQQIQLQYQTNLSQNYWFDPDKVGHIVYNLVANAIKFTPGVDTANGTTQHATSNSTANTVTVDLIESENTVQIIVKDSGVGIAPEKLPYIFDRFYQSHTPGNRRADIARHDLSKPTVGTGIGLALVKELVELMGGTATVDSVVGKGTSFTMTLPLQLATTAEAETLSATVWDWIEKPTQRSIETRRSVGTDSPLLLIVEDNAELRGFLAEELSSIYRVLTAEDGQQAWQMAQTDLPDVVVSDVMMPNMDGFALTNHLKSNPATDHIAVILLTAKATHDSRMAGLQVGADDYLTKPFHTSELQLRLRNLLNRQEKLRERYQQQLSQPDNQVPDPQTLDDGFLKKLYTEVENHFEDSTFGVEELADAMNMSRRTLHRKLTSLTNLTANDLLRQYRLKRATQLLLAGHPSSETAYMIGYDSPAHFTTIFKEFYGVTPSEYIIGKEL